MLGFVLLVEALGDALDVECLLEAPSDFGDGYVTGFVQLAHIDDHGRELAEEEVAGLAAHVEVIARVGLPVLPLHPVPEALGALPVGEDEQVLVVQCSDFLVQRCAGLGGGDRAVVSSDLEDQDP